MSTLQQTALSSAQVLAGAVGYHVVRNAPPVVKRKFPTSPYLMYDQESATSLPTDGDVYLAYVDGPTANLARVQAFVKEHAPKAKVLTCTRSSTYIASMFDVEPGAGSPVEVVPWFRMVTTHGIYRPIFYAALDQDMPAVESALKDAGIRRKQYRLIYAEWNDNPEIKKGYDGHQYATGIYDTSILGKKFFPLSQL